MDLEEEARAAAYRTQAANREAYALAMAARLAGDPVARAALDANWQAVTDYNDALKEPPDAEPEEQRQWNG